MPEHIQKIWSKDANKIAENREEHYQVIEYFVGKRDWIIDININNRDYLKLVELVNMRLEANSSLLSTNVFPIDKISPEFDPSTLT